MESIQRTIKASKRDKQTDHSKTMLTLDSEKQKTNFNENTKNKNKMVITGMT